MDYVIISLLIDHSLISQTSHHANFGHYTAKQDSYSVQETQKTNTLIPYFRDAHPGPLDNIQDN